jgi:DNA repair protein RadD
VLTEAVNPGDDRRKMTAYLKRTLTPQEARAALARFSSDSRGRSVR